jgi:2-dehydro-3-deoxygluconokinase
VINMDDRPSASALDQISLADEDLSRFAGKRAVVVALGETMLRDTPADMQRPEQTRLVHLSLAGSECTVAIMLARLGIPAAYVSRLPDNPYGWLLRDTVRGQGVNTDYLVWAPKGEPIGRYIYEIGRTPRQNVGWYQRMFSAASRLDAGMVNWPAVMQDCALFHTSGITFGLAAHSGYARNYLLAAFEEAMANRLGHCLVGLDFNYRATLWRQDECLATVTPVLERYVDILITGIYDMAQFYGIGCGRYSAADILNGDHRELEEEDLRAFGAAVHQRFGTRVVAVTMRNPENQEKHRWETVAIDNAGNYFRTPRPRSIVLMDRLGGGDTWTAGFYYGLLTTGIGPAGLAKGVQIGDAATCLKQTLMFDLPMVTRQEMQNLLAMDRVAHAPETVR